MAGDETSDPAGRDRIRLDPDHITLDGVDLGGPGDHDPDGVSRPSGHDFGLGALDDAEWGLSDEDLALGRYLQHRHRRRGRLFRLVAVIVVIAFVTLEVFTYLGRRDTPEERQQAADTAAHSDFGPTSREMSAYLLPPADPAVAGIGLVAAPGNSDDGAYDNRSREELDRGGPSAPTYGAQAGVVRSWTAPDGRTLATGIFLFEDRPSAMAAYERYLTAATRSGGVGANPVDGFTVITAPDGGHAAADRAVGRFLLTLELTQPAGMPTSDAELRALVRANAAVASAVH
jgi:hypothetical protein